MNADVYTLAWVSQPLLPEDETQRLCHNPRGASLKVDGFSASFQPSLLQQKEHEFFRMKNNAPLASVTLGFIEYDLPDGKQKKCLLVREQKNLLERFQLGESTRTTIFVRRSFRRTQP